MDLVRRDERTPSSPGTVPPRWLSCIRMSSSKRTPGRTPACGADRDGVRRAIAEWIGTWDEYSLEIRDYVDIPDGRVLVLWTERGRGKGSGIPIEHDGGYVGDRARGTEIARIHMYNDAGEALALGRPLIRLRTCVMRPGRLELPRSKRTTRPSTLRVYQFRRRRVREPSIEPAPACRPGVFHPIRDYA